MKKKLISLLQLAIGIGLIAFLIYRMKASGDISKLKTVLDTAVSHWPTLLAGFLGFSICLLLCTWRWKIILNDALGIRLPFMRLGVLYFIGHFFSSLLPGAVSGDLVKAVYVARETPDRKTEVVATVFIDRILGLIGLIILVVVMMVSRLPFFLQCPATKLALAFNLLLLGVTAAGLFLIFRQNLFEKWAFFRRIEQKTALGGILRRSYDAFRLCLGHRGVLAKTITISILNHVWLLVCCFLLGSALELPLRFIDYLTVFPVINAIAALPLTPGGLGTREAAAVYLLGALGVEKSSAFSVSILLYGSMLTWALIGGIVYMFFIFLNDNPDELRKEMKEGTSQT